MAKMGFTATLGDAAVGKRKSALSRIEQLARWRVRLAYGVRGLIGRIASSPSTMERNRTTYAGPCRETNSAAA